MTHTTVLVDPRPAFTKAVALGRSVLEGIRVDQFDCPTPCSDYDVRTLAGHLLAVLQRLAVAGAGGDTLDTADRVSGVADGDLVQAWQQRADEVDAVWRHDSVLADILTLPWAQLPGWIALMTYVNEVTVHTWDLAVATGQAPMWDDDVLELAYRAIQQGLPAEGRTGEGFPFADVVPVADDAPLIDKLVAWNGRRP